MNSAALLNVHVNIRDPLVNVVGEAYMNIFLLRRSPDVDKQSLIRLYQQQNIKTRQKLVNVSIVDATIFIRAKNEMPWHSSTDVLKCVRSRWHRAVKNSEDNCPVAGLLPRNSQKEERNTLWLTESLDVC